jgi:protein TonB
VIAWLRAHETYPEVARMEGTEGRVVVRFTASRDGRVLDLDLVQRSGARVLDEAASALLRGARLPPFPPTMASGTVVLTVPLDYRIE